MKTLLLGDLCQTKVNREFFEKEDLDVLFNDALFEFEGNDVFAVNLECAITDSDNAIKKYGPNLKVVKNVANVMKKIGVTVCGLSNNHIFDFGIEGVKDTISALDKAGIKYTGFGENYEDSRKNYIIEKNGEKIALVTVCEHEYSYALCDRMGSRPFDPFETMADIRLAKSQADRVIVMYHGGKEMCQYPSPRLINACREMANNGADVILCQHTHCIGCYENYNGSHILYGQGNFHFIYPDSSDIWNESLMVKYDTVKNEIEFIPTVNTQYGIELAKGEIKDKIMTAFEKRNASIKDGSWKDGWHKFCEEISPYYFDAAKDNLGDSEEDRGNTLFAHYLDCEAHTDVWRELYKTANHRNEK